MTGQLDVRRARVAVALLFAINGLLPAAWIGRLVDLQRDAGLDDAQLGVVMAMGAVGGLALGLLAGPLAARFGSGRVAVVGFLLMAPVTALLAFESTAVAMALTFFWVFGIDAIMDAAMNAHGVRVQKAYDRPILNSLHGWWSLGTVGGSLLAALSAALGWAIGAYLVALSGALMALAIVVWRWLLPGPDPDTHLEEDAGSDEEPSDSAAGRDPWWRGASGRRVLLLGAFILLAVMVEDIPARWSSIYLDGIGATGGLVSIGLVAFTVAMTVGRFTGDRLISRLGTQPVVAWGMGASAVVLALALLWGGIGAYVVACLVIGFGVAPLFPAAIYAAAHTRGLRPATGVAVVSWLSRAGFLLGPILVGLLAEARGVAWGIAVAVVAAALLVPLSRVFRERSSSGLSQG